MSDGGYASPRRLQAQHPQAKPQAKKENSEHKDNKGQENPHQESHDHRNYGAEKKS